MDTLKNIIKIILKFKKKKKKNMNFGKPLYCKEDYKWNIDGEEA
jgi:hypothetical protein